MCSMLLPRTTKGKSKHMVGGNHTYVRSKFKPYTKFDRTNKQKFQQLPYLIIHYGNNLCGRSIDINYLLSINFVKLRRYRLLTKGILLKVWNKVSTSWLKIRRVSIRC